MIPRYVKVILSEVLPVLTAPWFSGQTVRHQAMVNIRVKVKHISGAAPPTIQRETFVKTKYISGVTPPTVKYETHVNTRHITEETPTAKKRNAAQHDTCNN